MTADEVRALAGTFGFTVTKGPIVRESGGPYTGTVIEVRDHYEPDRTLRLDYTFDDAYGDNIFTFLAPALRLLSLSTLRHHFPLSEKYRTVEAWTALFHFLRNAPEVHALFRGYTSSPYLSLRAQDEALHDVLPALHEEIEAVLRRHKMKLRATKNGGMWEWGLDESFLYVEPLSETAPVTQEAAVNSEDAM